MLYLAITVFCIIYIVLFNFCRQIALPVSAFDGKQQLLAALRNSFLCGTLSLSAAATNSLVIQYWEQLRMTYLKNVDEGNSEPRKCFLANYLGWQSDNYWLLSPKVCSFSTYSYVSETDMGGYYGSLAGC
jgi:hypothetical protein